MELPVKLVAGTAAGVASTMVMHPLDVIKARMQVGTASNFFKSVVELVRTPSLAYRGLGINVLGNAAAWGAYYELYGNSQRILSACGVHKGPVFFWLSSFSAGVVTQAITNPMWVVKTRILGSPGGSASPYNSLISAIATVYRKDGIAGFWRGFTPSLLGTLQASVHFMFYEAIKDRVNSRVPETVRYSLASVCSKSLAVLLFYPHQVIRSRMQYNNQRLVETILHIYNKQGLLGFYRGLSANLLRVVPAMAITQLVYEKVYNGLTKEQSPNT